MEKIFQHTTISLVHLVYSMSIEKHSAKKADLEAMVSGEITSDVSGIIITCTVYSGVISSNEIKGIPVLKMEDPLIETIVADTGEKILFFSNPQTVALTMEKVEAAYKRNGRSKDYQVVVIPAVFSLILSNQKMAYRQALIGCLNEYIGKNHGNLYLMQLSMSVIETDDFDAGNQEIKTVFSEAKYRFQKIFKE